MTVIPRWRWRYVLAGVCAAIALLVAMTPTLLSTSAGNGLLLRVLNGRIPGRVSAERIKLGWLSGIAASGVALDDAEGRRILDASTIATELSLLNALRDPKPLGRSTIDVRHLDLVSYADGTNSITRALGQKGKPRDKRPAELPFIGDLRFTIHEMSWSGPGRRTLRGHDGSGRILIEGRRGRVSADSIITLDAEEIGATKLHAHLVGELDYGKGLISVTEPSVLEEGEASNRLEVAAGSRLSWGEDDSNVRLIARYDLRRLTVLLSPVLPSSLHLSGRHSADVHISGRLAGGKGLQRLRSIRVDPTTVAYDRISFHGLTLTRGSIPIRLADGVLSFDGAELAMGSGAIVLAGRIDLNGAEPRYLLDTPHVVARDIELDEQLARGPLSFLPFSWGKPSKLQGRATIRLDRASVPLSAAGMKREGSLAGHMFITNLNADAPAVRAIAGALGKAATLGKAHHELHEPRVDVPFALTEGRVHFQNVSATAGPLDLSFSGSVGLDGTIDAGSRVRAANVPTPASVAVKGTVQDPEVKVLSGFGSLLKLPGMLEKLHLPGR